MEKATPNDSLYVIFEFLGWKERKVVAKVSLQFDKIARRVQQHKDQAASNKHRPITLVFDRCNACDLYTGTMMKCNSDEHCDNMVHIECFDTPNCCIFHTRDKQYYCSDHIVKICDHCDYSLCIEHYGPSIDVCAACKKNFCEDCAYQNIYKAANKIKICHACKITYDISIEYARSCIKHIQSQTSQVCSH
jgi:hypothetical protein